MKKMKKMKRNFKNTIAVAVSETVAARFRKTSLMETETPFPWFSRETERRQP